MNGAHQILEKKRQGKKKIRFLVNRHTMRMKCYPWMLNKDVF